MFERAVYTTGSAARHFNIPEWKVRRLFERRILPDPARAGTYRLIKADEMGAVEEALVKVGYLSHGEASAR